MSIGRMAILIWTIGGLAVLAVSLLVVVPARTCSDDGGLPVLGLGRVVCAQPFAK